MNQTLLQRVMSYLRWKVQIYTIKTAKDTSCHNAHCTMTKTHQSRSTKMTGLSIVTQDAVDSISLKRSPTSEEVVAAQRILKRAKVPTESRWLL